MHTRTHWAFTVFFGTTGTWAVAPWPSCPHLRGCCPCHGQSPLWGHTLLTHGNGPEQTWWRPQGTADRTGMSPEPRWIRVSPGNDTNIQPGCAYLAAPLQPLWKCHQMPFYVCNKFSILLLCLFITSVYLTNNWSLDISKPARSASSPNTIYWSVWLWWPMNRQRDRWQRDKQTHAHTGLSVLTCPEPVIYQLITCHEHTWYCE